MAGQTSRLGKTKAACTAVGVLIMLVGVVLAVIGILPKQAGAQSWSVIGGCVLVLVGLITTVASALWVKIESNTFRMYGQLRDMHDLINKQTTLLARIADNSAISDAAKTLANREQECEALRAAIRGDVRTEQWDAALALVDEMESRFGYAVEAKSLRSEINEARVDTMRQKLNQASTMITDLLKSSQWDKALGEIERLHHALPDEPSVAELRSLYDSERQARKVELMDAWKKAASRNDIDGAISVLSQLDPLLTREEARSLEQSAREVFKEKLLQLGAQFQFAVSEKRWHDALEVGVQIMEEFPNSRMSQEVSDAMDGLRKRAGLLGDVEATSLGRS